MAIKIKKDPNNRFIRTFSAEVDLRPLGLDGSINVDYAAMQRADLDALNAKQINDEQFCRTIIRGVRGLQNEGGTEYSAEEQLEFVIGDIEVCKLVMDTFNDRFAVEKRGN